MRRNFLYLCLAALAAGCSTMTHIDGEWHGDATPAGGFRSVAVITLRDDPIERINFGTKLTGEFKSKGIKSTFASAILPLDMYDKNRDGRPDENLDRRAIQKYLHDMGYESILTVTVRNTRRERVLVRGNEQVVQKLTYDSFANAWVKTTEVTGQPDYYRDVERVAIETNLYNSADGVLCWKAASVTMDPRGNLDLADSYARRIGKALMEQKIVTP